MSQTALTLFLEKPQILYVDEDYSVKPPAYSTIAKLIQSLKENGPLVVLGKMGPSAYVEDSFKLKDPVSGNEIYGWKPFTFKEHPPKINVILIGARQTESNAHVYFILARDITRDLHSEIRGYQPLETDRKVYVMSYQNFLERSLVNLHPICPHAQWLFSIPVTSILDSGEGEKKCKQVGQEIFDHYKIASKGSTLAGKNALVRICNATQFLTNDGRKPYIERAWDRIGDKTWTWRS